MPIKDQQTRREYFKEYMANRRKGLTNPNPVKPEKVLNLVKPTPDNSVKPPSEVLNPELVKPIQTVKPNPVWLNPDLVVKPLASVKPTPDNSVKPENVKPVKPNPMLNLSENVKPPLWSSHYSVKKPYCPACFQAGIKEDQYAFCSQKRIQDALTIRLPNRYVCQVYHWTLYQGQGKKGGTM